MNESDLDRIRTAKKILGNPWAFIEQLEPEGDMTARPHALRHTLASIEQAAVDLQRDLWRSREQLGLADDVDPIKILSPEYAARWLGFDYEVVSSLGFMTPEGRQIIVAGLIDRPNSRIKIATDVGPRAALFTAAHEIGHIILHPDQTGLHRDRPISGPRTCRDRTEYEADKFAAFHLMPRKLLIAEFTWRFMGPFQLNEETAYALLGKPYHAAAREFRARRDLARKLAGAFQYNGRTFTSLVEYFGVSVEAMAIRLEELELV